VSESQPWINTYKPKNKNDLVGNKSAIEKLEKWMKSWVKKPPRKKAVFIHGPPGIGKTCAVHILAKEIGYDLFEINASDTRTKKRIEETLGRGLTQPVSIFGKKRMILFDEMEGVHGQKDRGGIQSIAAMIKITRSPIILIATTLEDNMEDKFRTLVAKSTTIEFFPISFSDIYKHLEFIVKDKGIRVDGNILDLIAIRSQGDLRSAINDLETISGGKAVITPSDIDWLGDRDRQDYTPNIINKIFSAKSLSEAKKTISQSMIPYDKLFEWIYENLPYIMDDPEERLTALKALAKADIFNNRAQKSNYRLLKYMFNDMTGGVSLHRKNSKGLGALKQVENLIIKNGYPLNNFSTSETKDGIMIRPTRWLGKNKWNKMNSDLRDTGAKWVYGQNFWLLPYIRKPQAKWRYIRTYKNRHNRKNLATKLAKKTHTSTQEAITDTLPLLKIIYKLKPENREEINDWLLLEDNEQQYLLG
jgi:replication factor C large subunit